ncbi:hypothetical protein [Caldovatus aquaticus]|uniref:Minor tail protein n=1 Tax=Caldovatus aquaticus TaxID=2865671 RepID=A0ABS7EYH8_9PROT|nr:hypothetical protein [Caldovatus aquaticus]MBW8268279.1 hypothetical protein [Caldovatus aquaticus]
MIGLQRPAWRQWAGVGYKPGRYYPFGAVPVTSTGAVNAADRLLLHPAEIMAPVTIDRLFLRVITAGAGSSVKMGLWRADGAGRPTGAPLAAVNAAQSTAVAGVVEAAVSPVRLEPGLYFAGSKFTGTLPTCTSVPGTSMLVAWWCGADTAANAIQNGGTNQMSGVYVANAFAGDMPDLTGASFTELTGASQGLPVLGFRVVP